MGYGGIHTPWIVTDGMGEGQSPSAACRGASSGPGLRYSFPISDETGVFAFGTTAIGWQVAAEDFSDVQAFVVCTGP